MMDPFTQILDVTQETDHFLPNITMPSTKSISKVLSESTPIIENPEL